MKKRIMSLRWLIYGITLGFLASFTASLTGCAPLHPLQDPVPITPVVQVIEQIPEPVGHVPPAWFTSPPVSQDTLYASGMAVDPDLSWSIYLAQTQAQAELSKAASDSVNVNDQRVLQMQRTNTGSNGEASRMAVQIISTNTFQNARRLKTLTFAVDGVWISYSLYGVALKRQEPFGQSTNIFNSNE